MELLLNEQQALLAEMAMRLCRDAGGPAKARALRDTQAPDTGAWPQVVAAGWPGMLASEAHGGSGLGIVDAGLAVEQAGRRLLMVPLVEAMVAAWAISRAEPSPAACAVMTAHIDGSALIVPATDAAHWRFGDANGGLTFDGRSKRLTGTIPFIAFAAPADWFLVAIASGAGSVLALVDAADARLSQRTQANVDGSAVSTLSFDGLAVTEEYIVASGDAAARLAGELQDVLTLLTSAELLGLAAEAHAMTMDYLKLRQQFGRAIGSFQALQHRAVNGFVDIELNRSLIYRVLAEFDRGPYHRGMVSAVKARATRVAFEVTRSALQLHGAVGYTDSHDIGLYYKRAIVLAARYGGELSHTGEFSRLAKA